MNKMLVFDMDGTIADLYGVDGWLKDLRSENTRPYEVAKPMVDMDLFVSLLSILQDMGWTVIINTWLAKGSTRAYDNEVRKAKKEWLVRYSVPYDEIHLTRYGVTKANATRKKGGFQVLFDDNENIRKGWTLGRAIEPNEIIDTLYSIIAQEF